MAVACSEDARWGAGMGCPPSHVEGDFCISGEGGRRPRDEPSRAQWATPERPSRRAESGAQGLIRRKAGERPSGSVRDGAVVLTPMIERIALIEASPVLRDAGRTAVGWRVKPLAGNWQAGMTRAGLRCERSCGCPSRRAWRKLPNPRPRSPLLGPAQ